MARLPASLSSPPQAGGRGRGDRAGNEVAKFPPLHPASSLEDPPELPVDATYRDKMSFRSEIIRLNERKAHNKKVKAEKLAWWRDHNNLGGARRRDLHPEAGRGGRPLVNRDGAEWARRASRGGVAPS